MKQPFILNSQRSEFSTLSNYVNTPRKPIEVSNRCRSFDPQFEDIIIDKAPLIHRPIQNRLLKETIHNLTEMGFHSCSLQNSQLNDPKTFILCFTFAYTQIDRTYKISLKWDEEYLKILRAIKYPYRIQRNELYQLSNSRCWPLILDSLHFIVGVAMYSRNFNFKLDYFESHNIATAGVVKLKWDYVIGTFIPVRRLTTMENLEAELKSFENSCPSEADIQRLEKMLKGKKAKIEEFNELKTYYDQTDKRLELMEFQADKFKHSLVSAIECKNAIIERHPILVDIVNEKTERNKVLQKCLEETKEVISKQPFNKTEMENLVNTTKLSNRRIQDLEKIHEESSNELISLQTMVTENIFKLEDILMNLRKRVNFIQLQCSSLEIQSVPTLSVTFTLVEWRKKETHDAFKEWINLVKQTMDNHYKNQLSYRLKMEKEIIEGRQEMIYLNHRRVELAKQVEEIGKKYQQLAENTNEVMNNDASNEEQTLLNLSNEKYQLKKAIDERKMTIIKLEAELHKKKHNKKQAEEVLKRDVADFTTDLMTTLGKIKEKLLKENDKADSFVQVVKEMSKFNE